MTKDEFESLRQVDEVPRMIKLYHITSHKGRTLLYGTTSGHASFHVYMKDREFHLYCYDHNGKTLRYIHGNRLPLIGIVPDDRIEAQYCDFEFCRRLQERGIYLPFAAQYRSSGDGDEQYHGKVYEGQDDYDQGRRRKQASPQPDSLPG